MTLAHHGAKFEGHETKQPEGEDRRHHAVSEENRAFTRSFCSGCLDTEEPFDPGSDVGVGAAPQIRHFQQVA